MKNNVFLFLIVAYILVLRFLILQSAHNVRMGGSHADLTHPNVSTNDRSVTENTTATAARTKTIVVRAWLL